MRFSLERAYTEPMTLLLIFAFIAGVVTILSPCILPILPIVLSGSLTGGHRKPLGIVAGFVLSFTFFTLALSSIVKATGLPPDSLRVVAVITIFVLGLSLVLPQTQLFLEQVFSRLSGLAPKANKGDGFGSGVLVGLSLGLIWAPCVGPILAAVITLAITSSVTWSAVLITLAYSLGSAVPMLAITYGGRQLLNRVPWLLKKSGDIQKGFGMIMMLAAVAIYFNVDRRFQTYILQTFPQYGAGLTQFEENELVKTELEKLSTGGENVPANTSVVDMLNKKAAPDFTGGTNWLNSPPLSLSELRGKVVLVDFWTYSCINCIRTLPYLREWYDKYHQSGFEIVGVHSPEFAFEKSTPNVELALKDFEIKYPVVQDNDFAIWRAYMNRYWPAKYLVDKDGFVRYTHFGEGAYDQTEKAIQDLLKETGTQVATDMVEVEEMGQPGRNQTPETYLGYERLESFLNATEMLNDQTVNYSYRDLRPHAWTLSGPWQVTVEHAVSQSPASQLKLQFTAKEVYLVMGADQAATIKVTVRGGSATPGVDVDPNSQVTVQEYRLYKLVTGPQVTEHGELELTVPAGVKLFAFTFGS